MNEDLTISDRARDACARSNPDSVRRDAIERTLARLLPTCSLAELEILDAVMDELLARRHEREFERLERGGVLLEFETHDVGGEA